ncbi:hypothetical protein BO94DRAFT_616912 [Aspergillus sclerotioniger CBS 115572]|uniref:Uncharacterized protein n=1 Tax=Aspergillus sclerotioniger CBS 115572 TaxID=1450535 RepID=A0A317WZ78_9EURO|nr:hypothetical protein BO94DRAFT_616912 [Aspergillus sclerotioniger CBS 115572]PWY91684.1 hypothetical protein BO94DRAFT_616912 [Aspergillus sclerotioniger CBS 115572]
MPGPQKKPKVAKGSLRIPNFRIPKSSVELRCLLARANLQSTTIHDIEPGYLGSGSGVNERQYALFLSFSPMTKSRHRLVKELKDFGLEKHWESAREIVEQSSEFSRYLAILKGVQTVTGMRPSSDAWPGAFKPTRDMQEQVVQVKGVSTLRESKRRAKPGSPGPPTRSTARRTIGRRLGRIIVDSFKPGHDHSESELDAISGPASGDTDAASTSSGDDGDPTFIADNDLPDADDEASVNTALILLLKELSQLIANVKNEWTVDHLSFSPKFGKAGYITITDGGLRSKATQAVLYIVEAKKRIIMQETAEIVGWLQQGVSSLLISTAIKTPGTHLQMRTYGPWNMLRPKDIKDFATLIVDMMLLAEEAV